MEKTFLSINEMAEKTGVGSQTLRNWEKLGVLKTVRNQGNRKLFSESQINDVVEIQRLKSEGYKLNNIKKMMRKNTNKSKQTVDYAGMSIDELTEIAKAKNIKYFRQMFKEELVEALKNPKNAEKMSEQAKIRTKERYGHKKYGGNVLVAASPIEKNLSKAGINDTKDLISGKDFVEQVISLHKSGKTNAQIRKILKVK